MSKNRLINQHIIKIKKSYYMSVSGNRRRRSRKNKQETNMASEVEVDGRPFDDDDYIETQDARESDDMSEELKTLDINADDNEFVTTDPKLSNLPKYLTSCITGNPDDRKSDMENSDSETIIVDDRNTRALAADEPTYKLETFEKNAMIIFNQYNIIGYDKPRVGTKEDGKRIRETFKRFNFEVKEYPDLTKKEIFETLDKFSKMDFTDYGCVAIVVMTHGGDQGLLKAKDDSYSEQDILEYFKHKDKPKLVTKPVVVIIQACRGIRDMDAAEAGQKMKFTEKDSILKEEVEHYHLPVEADTIVLHSSYISKASHREQNGTWFIKSLCHAIDRLSDTQDLESIMVEVKREVAIKNSHHAWNKTIRKYQINKQMPVVTSALMRKLYLRKFGDKPPIIRHTITDAMEPSTSRDCTDNIDNSFNQLGCPPMEILKRHRYMRNILKQLEDKNDVTSEFLLRKSSEHEMNCDIDNMKMSLLAMSNHIKIKFMGTKYQDFVFYYEMM
ncbi:caspase-3-like [Hyposmocoma kahamanoa]|uniref:caspase-3-like n=1 Tax=Hyposmocoma kahamanoa TaxID=1477025 RepID=UPI000E6D9D3A|nr:caspase-3-like [Hyposmocoma kahamanoa]